MKKNSTLSTSSTLKQRFYPFLAFSMIFLSMLACWSFPDRPPKAYAASATCAEDNPIYITNLGWINAITRLRLGQLFYVDTNTDTNKKTVGLMHDLSHKEFVDSKGGEASYTDSWTITTTLDAGIPNYYSVKVALDNYLNSRTIIDVNGLQPKYMSTSDGKGQGDLKAILNDDAALKREMKDQPESRKFYVVWQIGAADLIDLSHGFKLSSINVVDLPLITDTVKLNLQFSCNNRLEIKNESNALFVATEIVLKTDTIEIVGGLPNFRGIDFTPVRSTQLSSDGISEMADSGSLIHNVQSGKCLDVEGGDTAENARVIQYDCSGASNQLWLFEPKGDDYYQIRNVNSQMCLDITEPSQEDGAVLQQKLCSGNDNQLFQLKYTPSAKQSTFLVKYSGLCLDVPEEENIQIIQRECNNGDNQQWYWGD